MSKFNSQGIPDSRQCSIDGIKEIVATCIILRSDPFGFHYPPQGFSKVQMRRIRWKVKEKKSAFLPQHPQFLYLLVSMYACIVRHKDARCSSEEPYGSIHGSEKMLYALRRDTGYKGE